MSGTRSYERVYKYVYLDQVFIQTPLQPYPSQINDCMRRSVDFITYSSHITTYGCYGLELDSLFDQG